MEPFSPGAVLVWLAIAMTLVAIAPLEAVRALMLVLGFCAAWAAARLKRLIAWMKWWRK